MKKEENIFGVDADWKAVILCILTASTFWLFNAMNSDYTTNLSYPLQITDDEENPVELPGVPKELKFNATGPGWNLFRRNIRLNLKPIHIRTSQFYSKQLLGSNELLPLISQQLKDIHINYLITDSLNIHPGLNKKYDN